MCDWESLHGMTNPSEMAAIYENHINACLDKHAPYRRIRIQSAYNFGISDTTKSKMKERDKARQAATAATHNEKRTLLAKYKILRNAC